MNIDSLGLCLSLWILFLIFYAWLYKYYEKRNKSVKQSGSKPYCFDNLQPIIFYDAKMNKIYRLIKIGILFMFFGSAQLIEILSFKTFQLEYSAWILLQALANHFSMYIYLLIIYIINIIIKQMNKQQAYQIEKMQNHDLYWAINIGSLLISFGIITSFGYQNVEIYQTLNHIGKGIVVFAISLFYETIFYFCTNKCNNIITYFSIYSLYLNYNKQETESQINQETELQHCCVENQQQ